MQSRERKPPGYTLPGHRRQQKQHHSRERRSLDAKAPSVPSSHSPDWCFITAIAQTHSYRQQGLRLGTGGPSNTSIPGSKPEAGNQQNSTVCLRGGPHTSRTMNLISQRNEPGCSNVPKEEMLPETVICDLAASLGLYSERTVDRNSIGAGVTGIVGWG